MYSIREWEVRVPELETTTFVIPGEYVKNGDDRLVVLNRVALEVVEQMRGRYPEFVFTYNGKPITRMLNSAWMRATKGGLAAGPRP